jgi:hypothetical protein
MSLPLEDLKVFLSHSEQDHLLTRRIHEVLCRLHIRTFVYEYYLVGGTNRFDQIKNMISSTPYFVALLTKNGLESQWVNQEIGYAVGVNKTPIPILEINPSTGERLISRGFVEIHDPIIFNPALPDLMIEKLVYTLYSWLLRRVGGWRDTIWLTCGCGNEFDGKLDYLADYEGTVQWECSACKKVLSLVRPGFKLYHQ